MDTVKVNVTDLIVEGIKNCSFLSAEVKEQGIASLNRLNREYCEINESGGSLKEWRFAQVSFSPEVDLVEVEKKGDDIVHWAFLDTIIVWHNPFFPTLDPMDNFKFWQSIMEALIRETRTPDYEPDFELT